MVSVIIPAYRAAQTIAATLDSVLAQTFTDYEIIVVNDGSPDSEELEKALEPYRDRITYLRQENQGPSGARNAGILAARGRYVALLDADARIFGDVPEAGRTVMELCPSVGEVTFERLVTRHCTVHICVSVCRREALLRAGLFDPAFRRAEDVDLWLRIAMRGRRIAYQRRVLGCYRRRAGSLSSDRISMQEGFLAVLAKAARDRHLTTTQREVLERQLVVERASLELQKGKDAFRAGDAEAAVSHLTRANAQHKSLKLASVLTLLHVVPCFLRALYSWRDRHASDLKTQS